jgi:hypothetical protein
VADNDFLDAVLDITQQVLRWLGSSLMLAVFIVGLILVIRESRQG